MTVHVVPGRVKERRGGGGRGEQGRLFRRMGARAAHADDRRKRRRKGSGGPASDCLWPKGAVAVCRWRCERRRPGVLCSFCSPVLISPTGCPVPREMNVSWPFDSLLPSFVLSLYFFFSIWILDCFLVPISSVVVVLFPEPAGQLFHQTPGSAIATFHRSTTVCFETGDLSTANQASLAPVRDVAPSLSPTDSSVGSL